MCQAIVTVASRQDGSAALLDSLVNSLLISFSSYEIIDKKGQLICSAALLKTLLLARKGYLEGSQESAQLLTNLISAYTVLNNVTITAANGTYTRYPVNRAVRTRHTSPPYSVSDII